jgi:hypothetical protein
MKVCVIGRSLEKLHNAVALTAPSPYLTNDIYVHYYVHR